MDSAPRSDHTAARLRVLRAVEGIGPDLMAFVRRLVREKSITGEEGAAQELVRDKLTSLGARVDYWKPRPRDFQGYEDFISEEKHVGNRPNVVGVFKGGHSRKTLAFNGHIDVVPEGDPSSWKHPPYSGTLSGGKLYGRGACDMKAGLAATIFAVEGLLGAGVPIMNDIIVESVIGEESGGMGTLATILKGYTPDAAIIAEPTNLELCIAQAGCLMFRLNVTGKAAHGASRYMGVSAVEKFQPVLRALQDLERRRATLRKMSVFERVPNPVTLSIGTVHAGNWDSTVPESLVAEGRYGVWPGESLEEAKSSFIGAVESASAKDDWLKRNPPRITWFGPQWESAELDPSHWLVRLVQRAAKESLGFLPRLSGVAGGTDMRLFTEIAKRPAVIFGPGDDSTSHFSDECVKVKDIIRACKVYSMVALAWNE